MSNSLHPTSHAQMDTGPSPRSNLPVQLTPFVGRKEVMRDVIQHLLRDDVHLLTLIGPPGIGKTRLSLEVAGRIADHFSDGVWFVNLALINDPSLAVSTIAHSLGLKQAGDRPLRESLLHFLLEKRLLLVLDNFEHVVDAAPLVVEFLSSAPGVKALVTSREALRVRGEQEFTVPPLALPKLDRLPTAEQISRYEAVQLFAQRARSANLDFHITDENALVVAAICWRLDGLPLAIELAAVRTKLLPPQALFERLGQRLAVLTGGARDLPPRHRTLRSAIDWSYNLLDESERSLFRRLGVFVGGCRLDAVDAVCNADGTSHITTLDSVATLVEKSLVQQTRSVDGGWPRLVLLETIKEYALEQLEESHELADVKRRHALHFLQLAQEIEPYLMGPDQTIWLDRLEEEHDNLRATLQWSQSEDGDAKLGLDMAVALGRFWSTRGYLHEGRAWLSVALSKVDSRERTPALGNALKSAGLLAYFQSDYSAARNFFEESLAILREQGNKRGIADALDGLGEIAHYEGDYKRAILLYEEWLSISRELEDIQGIANALLFLGYAELRLGESALSVARLEEALALTRQIGIPYRVAEALRMLGEVAVRQGDYDRATPLLQESLGLSRELENKWGIAACQGTLAWVALLQADYVQAIELLIESMLIRKETGDKGGIAWCLEKLAEIANRSGDWQRAAHLLGAAQALRDSAGSVVDMADRLDYERTAEVIHAQLGEKFSAAWEAGYNMVLSDPSIGHAISYALESKVTGPQPASTVHDTTGLTRREHEVAILIAQSKSNAEIAELLVVSKRTVETHITNILSKLNFSSRGQIAAWAINQKLTGGI
jgi:predicted ATPase/DNA-binding CsgD family transcriptional regulator